MAGYVMNPTVGTALEFHTDTPNVRTKIKESVTHNKVIMLQLDCDELDAALWGLENYRKNELPFKEDHKSNTLRTIVTFNDKTQSRKRLLDTEITNIAVGQMFVLDDKDTNRYDGGRITNIKHVMFPDRSFLTYIDVSVSYPVYPSKE